jgi:hypothetical protein
MRPYLEKPFTKIGLVEAQGEGPEFKPQYLKKITTNKKKQYLHKTAYLK